MLYLWLTGLLIWPVSLAVRLQRQLAKLAHLLSTQETDAGIGSFDVISVTEKFANENPELVGSFLEVTEEANLRGRHT